MKLHFATFELAVAAVAYLKQKGFWIDPNCIIDRDEDGLFWVFQGECRPGKSDVILDFSLEKNYVSLYGFGVTGAEAKSFSNFPDFAKFIGGFKSIPLNSEYSAVISEDKKTVKVGCQTFPAEAVLKLAEALK